MAVSKRLRWEILRRDGFRCQGCGFKAGEDGRELRVDHVIPEALGGLTKPSNLQALCEPCNSGKSSTSPDEHVVEAVDERAKVWGSAMAQAAAERREMRLERQDKFDDIREAWESWKYPNGATVPLPAGWEANVATFYEAGLEIADFKEFITAAMNSKAKSDAKWKYFCKCCWNTVRQLQERAQEIVDSAGRCA